MSIENKNMIVLKGTIENIFPSQIFGSLEKRSFWIKEDKPRFPETWELEMKQGDCVVLDKFKLGQLVECTVLIKGFKSNKNGTERVFNSLTCTLIKISI